MPHFEAYLGAERRWYLVCCERYIYEVDAADYQHKQRENGNCKEDKDLDIHALFQRKFQSEIINAEM